MNSEERYSQYLAKKQLRLKTLHEFREVNNGNIDPETFGDTDCGRILCEKFAGLIKDSRFNKKYVKIFFKIWQRAKKCYSGIFIIRRHKYAQYLATQVHKDCLSDIEKYNIPKVCRTYCRNLLLIELRRILRLITCISSLKNND